MAEVLSIVASGVSIAAFAGQIASSVLKLKSLIDQVKDAPDDIKLLIDEIETFQFLLVEIEEDQSRYPYSEMLAGSQSASRLLQNCQRGVEQLQKVVDEMATDVENIKPLKRKLLTAKIVWKRNKIEGYRNALASSVRLLTLSYQIYTKYADPEHRA